MDYANVGGNTVEILLTLRSLTDQPLRAYLASCSPRPGKLHVASFMAIMWPERFKHCALSPETEKNVRCGANQAILEA
jgi:hypothetical protein